MTSKVLIILLATTELLQHRASGCQVSVPPAPGVIFTFEARCEPVLPPHYHHAHRPAYLRAHFGHHSCASGSQRHIQQHLEWKPLGRRGRQK